MKTVLADDTTQHDPRNRAGAVGVCNARTSKATGTCIRVRPAPHLSARPRFGQRLGNPLLFEDVLIRLPNLRLYVMHAGWPFLDEMIALLYAYPSVYVDVGVIDWTQWLTAQQRSDILYHNAARFLRL